MITKFFDLGECQFSRDLALCRTDLAEEKKRRLEGNVLQRAEW